MSTNKKNHKDPFRKSGTPWIWLNAGAVTISVIMVVGLLALIAARGLGHFWPKTVYEIEYLNNNEKVQIIGERVETEKVLKQRILESGVKVESDNDIIERSLIKVGNRDALGVDFMLTVAPNELYVDKPKDVLVLERTQWGNFYGFLQQVKSNGEVLNLDELVMWQELDTRLGRVAELRERIEHIEKVEIGRINYQIEKLRLKKRGLELDGVTENEKFQEIEDKRAEFNSAYEELKSELNILYQEIS